jgi:UDP-N-acetylglucosamine--N-acetylmuramyl-(pentapeptide) pyrophosphoryl-undecaprenol N-acetylglucosamine transferase
MVKIILTGGGTGGHVFPGIAVAKELMRHPEVELLYVGKENGPEAKWVPDAGIPFAGITASGMPRSLTPKLFGFARDLARGLGQSWKLVRASRPDAVFSTGGYVSVPVSLAAALQGVPVGLFEPNVQPGLAARLLGFFAKRVFVGFEETLHHFSKRRSEWTGIPVREEILSAEKKKSREVFGLNPDIPTLLMLGGSQGARSLNRLMVQLLRFLGQGDQPVQAIFMTGWADYQPTVDELEKCPLKMVLRPFIANIHEAYAASDLVVSRSGALTCAELTSRSLPALFIPYPHASAHQEKNARVLEKAGAARVFQEEDLDEEILCQSVISLLSDNEKLTAMGRASGKLCRPRAAQQIVEGLLELSRQRKTA